MLNFESLSSALVQHWPVWLVTVVLVVSAVVDGWKLKVPNLITYPLILSGWAYSAYAAGWGGLGWSLLGTVVGLAVLLPLYSIGGMGAGDVKLFAGVGAWVWPGATLWAFFVTAIVGGAIAIIQVLWHGAWHVHYAQFWQIAGEIMTIRNPEKLAEIAAERKSSMRLLPYGIPIAIGSIAYFAWAGMLL